MRTTTAAHRPAPGPEPTGPLVLPPGPAYLRALRERVDRGSLGLDRPDEKGLTQPEVAELLTRRLAPRYTISDRRFRAFEKLQARWPQHIAEAYAALLQLCERDQQVFYAVIGRLPRRMNRSDVDDSDLHHLTHTLGHTPSYLSDRFWDMRYRNEAFAKLIPELVPGMNIMQFVLTSARGREIFPDFRSWAVPMLDQLRTALLAAEEPTHREGLEKVVEDLLRHREVAEVWHSEQAIDLGPNGDVRLMRPASPASPDGLGELVPVQLYVTVPIGKPTWRFMSVTRLDCCADPAGAQADEDPEFWFRRWAGSAVR